MPLTEMHPDGSGRRPARRPGRVMVVDDQALMRQMLGDTLVGAGHRVHLAGGVQEGLDILAGAIPQVVIVDLVMPGGGGAELCRRLGALGAARPHIIVVSALGDHGAMLEAFEAGADDFLRKPVEPTEMLSRVRAGLRSWRDRRLAARLTERARRDARRSREILDSISEGLLVVAGGGRVSEANPAAARILGLPAARIVGARRPYPWWPEEAHEERTAAYTPDAAGREIEVVLKRGDGRRFPALVCVSSLNDGVSGGHIVTIRDLTQQMRARRALESSRQEQRALRTIAEAIARDVPAAQIFTTISRQMVDAFAAEHGVVVKFSPEGPLVVASTTDLGCIGTVIANQDGGLLAQVRATSAPVRTDYRRLPEADPIRMLGEQCGLTDSSAAPVALPTGLWGAVMIATSAADGLGDQRAGLAGFADMTALAVARDQNQEHLARQAATDPLTGLANRRTLTETFERHRAHADRHERPLTLLIADLDHFKELNDNHGHGAGDRALIEFARLLTECARGGDVVARIGGEEFAWLMPDTDLPSALAAGERLRALCERTAFGPSARITCSAGVGRLRRGESETGLIARCDEALYRAKGAGRNRVEATEDGTDPAGPPDPAKPLTIAR